MRDHEGETVTETITIGPIGAFFTNKNAEMNLPGHSHSAEITIEFETIGAGAGDSPIGFPSFHSTTEQVIERIMRTLQIPIVGTNEAVARALYKAFKGWSTPEIDAWPGAFRLKSLTLAVRGVRDRIGHSDGFTRYTIARHNVGDGTGGQGK